MDKNQMTYRDWVWQHRRKFMLEDYALRDVIDLSRAVGFECQEIRQTLRNWPRALWTPGDPEQSAAKIARAQVEHLDATIKIIGGTSLAEQWSDLGQYLLYGRTWEDAA